MVFIYSVVMTSDAEKHLFYLLIKIIPSFQKCLLFRFFAQFFGGYWVLYVLPLCGVSFCCCQITIPFRYMIPYNFLFLMCKKINLLWQQPRTVIIKCRSLVPFIFPHSEYKTSCLREVNEIFLCI